MIAMLCTWSQSCTYASASLGFALTGSGTGAAPTVGTVKVVAGTPLNEILGAAAPTILTAVFLSLKLPAFAAG